jgi:hypothetical protein
MVVALRSLQPVLNMPLVVEEAVALIRWRAATRWVSMVARFKVVTPDLRDRVVEHQ